MNRHLIPVYILAIPVIIFTLLTFVFISYYNSYLLFLNFQEMSSPRLIYYDKISPSISRLKELEISAGGRTIISDKGEDGFTASQFEVKWKAGDKGINIRDVIIPFDEYTKIDILFQKDVIDPLIFNKSVSIALSDIGDRRSFQYTIPGNVVQKQIVDSWETAVWLADKYSSQVKNKCAMGIIREMKVTAVHTDVEKIDDLKILIDATTKKISKVQEPTPTSLRVDFEGYLCNQPTEKVVGHYITEYKPAGFDSVNTTFQNEARWQNKSNFLNVLWFALVSIVH